MKEPDSTDLDRALEHDGGAFSNQRVIVVAPMPPEKSAYALARYSRSPDSVKDSLAWVRDHSSEKFLDSFYFQYGHASIADLGHCIFCFEGISELAAIEIEDEQLWDGQAKSSRYQDFSRGKTIVPGELKGTDSVHVYTKAASELLTGYLDLHKRLNEYLVEQHPKPEEMKGGAYRRTIAARAYDVARYLLFSGISTNVGQVTSIRTLEKQMRRMGVSEYDEVRGLAVEMHEACAAPPACSLDGSFAQEALAPTLAKYAEPDRARSSALERVEAWASQNFDPGSYEQPQDVDLVKPADSLDEISASWLYAVTSHPFRVIQDVVSSWSRNRRLEVLEVALQDRKRHDELLQPFRSGYRYIFDIVMDIGAYRDIHRHRRCQQIRQKFSDTLGYEYPALLAEAGVQEQYEQALQMAATARASIRPVSESASHYLLPFATRCRSLYKMDYAEAEYIARVRSGVKGHFSYRKVAWEMRERIMAAEPELGAFMQATPPGEEDALTR